MSVLLNIGDFSRMTFLGVKTLRYYHDIGLLPPAEVDPDTGYRRYALGQVPTAQVIRRLRELGMSIEEVRAVIEAADVSVRNAAIAAHLQRMEGELERTRETVKALRLLLDENAPSIIAVEYRVVGPTEALAIRSRLANADAFAWLDGAFSELRSAFVGSGVRRAGADAALYSNELLEDEFGELTAVVPVTGTARPSGRAEPLVLPRAEYAIAVHSGSVADIDRTYAALGAVVAERSIGVPGPIREDYLVGANDTDDESQYRTEICWPVFQTTSG